jgi:hypothetical protein
MTITRLLFSLASQARRLFKSIDLTGLFPGNRTKWLVPELSYMLVVSGSEGVPGGVECMQ